MDIESLLLSTGGQDAVVATHTGWIPRPRSDAYRSDQGCCSMKSFRLLSLVAAVTATVTAAAPVSHAAPDHLDHSRTPAEMRAAHGIGQAPARSAEPAAQGAVSRAAAPRSYGGVALSRAPATTPGCPAAP